MTAARRAGTAPRAAGAVAHRPGTTGSSPSSPPPSGCSASGRFSDDLDRRPGPRGRHLPARRSTSTSPSKDAVLLTLLDRVVEEADARRTRRRSTAWPRTRGRAGARRSPALYETFRAHRAVALACAQARADQRRGPRALGRGDGGLGPRHRRPRSRPSGARGAAPPGLPARDLAIALNSMNERVLYATFAGDGPALAEPDVVDVLLDVWLTSIYRTTVPG